MLLLSKQMNILLYSTLYKLINEQYYKKEVLDIFYKYNFDKLFLLKLWEHIKSSLRFCIYNLLR